MPDVDFAALPDAFSVSDAAAMIVSTDAVMTRASSHPIDPAKVYSPVVKSVSPGPMAPAPCGTTLWSPAALICAPKSMNLVMIPSSMACM